MGFLKILFSRLLRRFPRPSLAPGSLFSRLDVAAEQAGLELVEDFFAGSALCGSIVRVYRGYMDDEEAGRALKKGYHVMLEQRLRTLVLREDAGAPGLGLSAMDHPLDAYAAAGLVDFGPGFEAGARPSPGPGMRLRHWALGLSAGAWFLMKALWIGVRYGRFRCRPMHCRVATPGFGAAAQWSHLRAACEALGDWEPGHLVVVAERGTHPALDACGFPTVHPGSLPVPVRAWLRRVVGPGVWLFLRLLPLSVLALRDSRCQELICECFRQASVGLRAWRVALNVRFRAYLDNVEYDAIHNVKAMVFRKFGGRLVRWPHSQMDVPGAGLSYLDYDVFLSGGDYQVKTYGHSWSRGVRAVSVGLLSNDRRAARGQDARSSDTARIEALRASGRKLAVFFGCSMQPTIEDSTLEVLAQMRGVLAGREDWGVVVKPKGLHQSFYERMEADDRLRGWLDEESVVGIRYRPSNLHTCPVGWLIDRMAFGVCVVGSVQVEGLTQGVPVFSYSPFCRETPYTGALARSGLHHRRPEPLGEAMHRYVEAPGMFDIPFDWFRDRFDPFGDDGALLRAARVALECPGVPMHTMPATIPTEKAGGEVLAGGRG